MQSSIKDRKLLSFVTSKSGDQIFIHADRDGLNLLIKELTWLRERLEQNECDHTHLISPGWAGQELTISKLKDQEGEDLIVHEVKIYGWNDEWKKKHALVD